MTVREALARGRERLRGDRQGGRFDALRLLELCAHRSGAWIVAHDDDSLDPATVARYLAGIERRAQGEPIAYIAGEAGFYGRTFGVTPDVLVPRPESEHLVALALAARDDGFASGAAPRVCDVGTGSGILAITLACAWPAAEVTAIDVSAAALAVAAANAERHAVRDRVRFVRGDLFSALAVDARFACIVANLPYVRTADLERRPHATAFEPVLARDGGPDGLAFYRRLLSGSPERLEAPGVMLLEAAPDTAQPLAELARRAFPSARVGVRRDYSGRERVVEVRRGTVPPTEKANHP